MEPVEVERIGRLYRVNKLSRFYRDHLSGYDERRAKDELFFPENLGPHLAIDETALSRGELYTILTNKDSGKLVALIRGTKAEYVCARLTAKLPVIGCFQVQSLTLDLASSYDWVGRTVFPNAEKIIDRFHVQKLVTEALQALRIIERQKVLASARGQTPRAREPAYKNGDTRRELLARSRYLLFKPRAGWTKTQRERAQILFQEYPKIEVAYDLTQNLREIYEAKISRSEASLKLRGWLEAVNLAAIPELEAVASTILKHEDRILNFWNNRETNAFAESFNAKLKHFRGLLRGVRDLKFFLFRCQTYFA